MAESVSDKKKFSLGKNDRERRNNLLVIFLSVLLIVVIILFYSQYREHTRLMKSITLQKDSLQSELKQMVNNYDSLKTDNDTLNAKMFDARSKVKDLLLEVGQIKKASYAEISNYQREVGSLQKIMRNYIVQVDSLNQRNQLLMAENEKVKKDYLEVQSKNEKLQKERRQLTQKVKQAAMLEALNLQVDGINSKGKEVNKSFKAEKLRISFTLSENVTAPRGPKIIYVRILRPDQILLTRAQNGRFRFEDLKIPYSAKRQITYEGKSIPVNIYWDNRGAVPFEGNGSYTIDVFADGNNIGTTSFSFKK